MLFVENFGSRDVGGHQIGRELDTLEIQIQDVSECLDEEGLGQPGNPRNQAMTGGEERDQHLLDGFVLSDDDLPQLGEDALPAFRDSFRADGRGV